MHQVEWFVTLNGLTTKLIKGERVPIVDASGIPTFGNASIFMLGHLSIDAVLIEICKSGKFAPLFDGI